MKIEDGKEYVPEKAKNKTITIISTLIAVTLLIVVSIVIIMLVTYKQNLSVNVDGQKVSFSEDTFLFAEGTNDMYISIKDVAELVGYEAHNGEYKINSEDVSKMYVEAKNGTETSSFFLNSTQISKVPPNSDKDYENIQIENPVISYNGKLYVSEEGFSEGFNSLISYNQEENMIVIQTLPYLVEYYKANIANFGYSAISEDFNNQKALIYGMLVASKETTGKFGVVNTFTNKEVISPKYNKIEFIESSREFIITNSSEKVGIAYSTGETKINVLYDEIKSFDSKLGYYLVKSNSKYGVINSQEELVIHIEYDTIGIDSTEYPADRISNQYILCGELIPVCLNKKWGFFDTKGNKVSDPVYDEIGCIASETTDKVVDNAMVVGDSGVVVVATHQIVEAPEDEENSRRNEDENEEKNVIKTYGGINVKGDLLLPIRFENVYSITSGGETTYYVTYKGEQYKAMSIISEAKRRLGYSEEEPKSTPEPTTDVTPEPEASPNVTPTNDIGDVIL